MFKDASTPLLEKGKDILNTIQKSSAIITTFNTMNNGIEKEPMITHRLVDRQGYFQQSLGKYNIKRIGSYRSHIYASDIFHTLIDWPTTRIIVAMMCLFSVVIWAFAVLFRFAPRECSLGVNSMVEAWLFSLETIMTIGYGAPENDVFFGNCYYMTFLLTLESFCSIILEALCIGIFFARFSRAQTRASTIAFTNYAVIKKIDSNYYLCFKTCERRKHQLVEAHIRCYAIRHEYDLQGGGLIGEPYRVYQMRLTQPDDDLGATLLMALPQEIIHRIDPWSPLYPYIHEATTNPNYNPTLQGQRYPDPPQRAIDCENGNREAKIHNNEIPKLPTQKDIETHLQRTSLEVVVILEGIDPPTSATIQARHSYTIDDMLWNHDFTPCITRDPETKAAIIDFDRFYEVIPQKIDIIGKQHDHIM